MTVNNSGYRTTRRRFAFWVGMGLFTLGERLHATGLDSLAAAAMRVTDSDPKPSREPAADSSVAPAHWTAGENNTWRWFERESWATGRWKVTGITSPINKRTGEPYTGKQGYLDETLVPNEVRFSNLKGEADDHEDSLHRPDPSRRSRHGRPPSKWLRSLNANELRIWLKTVDVPEAGVSGMTFYEHLTRDHSFDPSRIAGLDDGEQAQLHAAAHYGY